MHKLDGHIAFIIAALLITGCTSYVRFSSETEDGSVEATKSEDVDVSEPDTDVFYGKASYYADKFHGRTTASGEVYNSNEFTAAHRSLPFGTIVEVENLQNERSVRVRINDRGPFKSGRVIDLSRAAAEEIGMVSAGVVDVEVRVIEKP